MKRCKKISENHTTVCRIYPFFCSEFTTSNLKWLFFINPEDDYLVVENINFFFKAFFFSPLLSRFYFSFVYFVKKTYYLSSKVTGFFVEGFDFDF